MHIPDLTIIVNVHERQWTLPRAFAYLEDFAGPVLVSDSSQRACPDMAGYPWATYVHTPGMFYFEKMRNIAEQVRTPYMVVVPDDDYTLLSGMAAAVAHLRANPDVVVVQGHLLRFRHHGGKIVIDLEHIGANLARHIAAITEGETVAARIKRLIDHPVALNYGVTRTDAFLLPHKLVLANQNLRPARFFDRLTLFALAGAGRVTFMDVAMMIRSTERTPPETFPKELEGEVQVTALRDRLGPTGGPMTAYLVRQAGLSHEAAEAITQYFVDRNTKSFTKADFDEGMPATAALVAGAMRRQAKDIEKVEQILRRPGSQRPAA
jgi:glycosyltransferase domain-containing protein